MTKKTISMMGAVVLSLGLVACGGSTKSDSTTPKAASTDATATPPATGNPCQAPAGQAPATGNPCGK